jgi:hypothetical protein
MSRFDDMKQVLGDMQRADGTPVIGQEIVPPDAKRGFANAITTFLGASREKPPTKVYSGARNR